MNILGDPGIESGPDGLWPGAHYQAAAPIQKTPVEPDTGYEMHLVQTRIHELGVTLNRLYEDEPVDQDQVVCIKAMRSELRKKNRKLEEKLEAEKVAQTRPMSHSWTLASR